MEGRLVRDVDEAALPTSVHGPAAGDAGVERRSVVRLSGRFPARVRGTGRRGEVFVADAVVENISAGGLYLHLGRCVEAGAAIFIIAQLSSAEVCLLRVAVRGVVLRAVSRPCGEWGVAVAIMRHRFLRG